jgi:hypothetical protein
MNGTFVQPRQPTTLRTALRCCAATPTKLFVRNIRTVGQCVQPTSRHPPMLRYVSDDVT